MFCNSCSNRDGPSCKIRYKMFCGESPQHFANRMQITIDWNIEGHWPHRFDPILVIACQQFRS